MSDYISREAAIKYFRKQTKDMQDEFEMYGGEFGTAADIFRDVVDDLKEFPAADVQPVRHGRWTTTGQCSECCGFAPLAYSEPDDWYSPFCPNCGVKMDLEVVDEQS